MKALGLILFLVTFQLSAAFNEDCKIKVSELKPFVDSSEMILFAQMQNAYNDTINVCHEVYTRLGDEQSFEFRVRQIANSCAQAYAGKEYEGKFFDLLQCKTAKLYNMER